MKDSDHYLILWTRSSRNLKSRKEANILTCHMIPYSKGSRPFIYNSLSLKMPFSLKISMGKGDGIRIL